MKKVLVILGSVLFLTSSALAASDSVGVFLRSEKVLVVTKELSLNRLSSLMDAFQAEEKLVLDATEKGFRFVCRRDESKAACTFAFFPSSFVSIEAKALKAEVPVTDLVEATPADFSMAFQSSRDDFFQLEVKNGVVKVLATKR